MKLCTETKLMGVKRCQEQTEVILDSEVIEQVSNYV